MQMYEIRDILLVKTTFFVSFFENTAIEFSDSAIVIKEGSLHELR